MKTSKRSTKATMRNKLRVSLNVAPSWMAMLPWYLSLLDDGDAKGQATARKELARMAEIADKYVAYVSGTEFEPVNDKPIV